MGLSDYHATTGNWREQLQRNERKTRAVIFTFIIVYVLVGLIVDVILLEPSHRGAPISQLLLALITFKAIPYATLILGGVAIVSLLIAYSLYDKIMLLGTDSREITPATASTIQEKQLYNVVEEMKVAAGLQYMPKVYIIEANYMNAFATGYSEKSAMVAITRGLMEKLDRAEMQAVMAHELSHIRHHDIKLTLMVAVLSNIMLIVIDTLFYSMLYRRDRRQDNRLLMVIIVLRYVLPLLTVMLALFLSRSREYMADAGSVELMRDNEPMGRALLKIANDHQTHADEYSQEYGNVAHEQIRQVAYLFDPSTIDPVKSLNNMFSSHPYVADRLEAIGFKSKNKR